MQFVHSAQKWTPFFMSINTKQLTHKTYLGDAVYVGFDGYHVWLYSDNGLHITNEIALEPPVLANFHHWETELRKSFEPCVLTSPDKSSMPSSTDSKD
jgi:hypothetical protein